MLRDDGAGRARVRVGCATAGWAVRTGAGWRTIGTTAAGCTRPVRLTGTTRVRLAFGFALTFAFALALGAAVGRRVPSNSIDGGAGGIGSVATTRGDACRMTRVAVGV